MENYCVYYHLNKINNKLYIEMTCMKSEERWGHNGLGYQRQSDFYNDIQKYGWDNFAHVVFMSGLHAEAAAEIESTLIDTFNTKDPECGYNRGRSGSYQKAETRKQISKSEQGAKHHYYGQHRDEETRRKISESLSGANHPCYGKHLPEITRQRIGNAHRGKPSKASYSMQKVLCVETNKIFNSIADVEKEMDINHSLIHRVINGTMTQTHGYHFKRIGEKYLSKKSV